MAPVDDEVGVLLRDLRIADLRPFEPDGLDQLPGRLRFRVLEHAAGVGQRQGLGIPPVTQIFLHDRLDGVAYARSELKPYAHNDPPGHDRASIPELDG